MIADTLFSKFYSKLSTLVSEQFVNFFHAFRLIESRVRIVADGASGSTCRVFGFSFLFIARFDEGELARILAAHSQALIRILLVLHQRVAFSISASGLRPRAIAISVSPSLANVAADNDENEGNGAEDQRVGNVIVLDLVLRLSALFVLICTSIVNNVGLGCVEINHLAKSNLELINIEDGIVVFQERGANHVDVAAVEQLQLAQVLARVVNHALLCEQVAALDRVIHPTRKSKLQISDLVAVVVALLSEHAHVRRIVAVDFLLRELFSEHVCHLDVIFCRQAHARVPSIELHKSEVVLKKPRVSVIRRGQISLPSNFTADGRTCEPFQVLLAALHIRRIVVSNLNRSLLRVLVGDEHGHDGVINYFRSLELLEQQGPLVLPQIFLL